MTEEEWQPAYLGDCQVCMESGRVDLDGFCEECLGEMKTESALKAQEEGRCAHCGGSMAKLESGEDYCPECEGDELFGAGN